MAITHNLGFPRIGAKRELKFALETYWKGQSSLDELEKVGAELRQRHWQDQADLDLVPGWRFFFLRPNIGLEFYPRQSAAARARFSWTRVG